MTNFTSRDNIEAIALKLESQFPEGTAAKYLDGEAAMLLRALMRERNAAFAEGLEMAALHAEGLPQWLNTSPRSVALSIRSLMTTANVHMFRRTRPDNQKH